MCASLTRPPVSASAARCWRRCRNSIPLSCRTRKVVLWCSPARQAFVPSRPPRSPRPPASPTMRISPAALSRGKMRDCLQRRESCARASRVSGRGARELRRVAFAPKKDHWLVNQACLAELTAFEPIFAAPIERRDLRPVEARHVGLHFVADPGLEIGKVPVAFGKLFQQITVQLKPCGRVDRIETILFVDRLAQHQPPTPVALLQEVVESPGAHHIAEDAIDARSLRDRHLGLSDGARASDVDRRAAEEMQDAHAALVAILAHPDEFIRGALKPGRHHAPVVMPDSAETVPHERVAPDGPVLNQVADGAAIVGFAVAHAVLGWPLCDIRRVDLAKRELRWQAASQHGCLSRYSRMAAGSLYRAQPERISIDCKYLQGWERRAPELVEGCALCPPLFLPPALAGGKR